MRVRILFETKNFSHNFGTVPVAVYMVSGPPETTLPYVYIKFRKACIIRGIPTPCFFPEILRLLFVYVVFNKKVSKHE